MSSFSDVTINGGTVTANGATDGAGIGGGYLGAGGTVEINGGTVTANGGLWAAGIGGGYAGASGAISITGGDVTANGNVGGNPDEDGGAGIGGGEDGDNSGDGDSISIIGGTVTATVPTGTLGAAIGNGGRSKGTDCAVTIGEGATIEAGANQGGTGATAVTDVANNKTYKYAKIFFADTPALDPVDYIAASVDEGTHEVNFTNATCGAYEVVTDTTTAFEGDKTVKSVTGMWEAVVYG